jgi:TonB family protein
MCSTSRYLFIAALGCASAGQQFRAKPETSCALRQSRDSTVYDTTQVTEKPSRRGGPQPQYPASAMMEGVQGTVILAAIVEPTGIVDPSSITFVQRLDSRLDRSALRTLRDSWFWPGCRGDSAVRVRIAVPVTYSIR